MAVSVDTSHILFFFPLSKFGLYLHMFKGLFLVIVSFFGSVVICTACNICGEKKPVLIFTESK